MLGLHGPRAEMGHQQPTHPIATDVPPNQQLSEDDKIYPRELFESNASGPADKIFSYKGINSLQIISPEVDAKQHRMQDLCVTGRRSPLPLSSPPQIKIVRENLTEFHKQVQSIHKYPSDCLAK